VHWIAAYGEWRYQML